MQVVLFNLWELESGEKELDTESVPDDIQLRGVALPAVGKVRNGTEDEARPRAQSFRVPLFAARTLNATGQSRVTISLR